MTAAIAEEAGAASTATSARSAGSQASAAAGGTGKTQTQAQRQRQQIDAIKAKRKPAATPEPAPAPKPKESATDAVKGGAPGEAGYVADKASAPARALAAPLNTQAAQAGGGFLLGLMGWALALAYLRGGPAEVRKLLAAKFLNKVGP